MSVYKRLYEAMRLAAKALGAIALCLAASGCAGALSRSAEMETAPEDAQAELQTASLGSAVISGPPPEPKPKAAPPPPSIKLADDETPLPAEKPPVTSLDETDIVGADAVRIQQLIGPPETISRAAPSQTWYYASGACRLILQLFNDLESGNFRALKYEISGGTFERCMAQFERLNRPIEYEPPIPQKAEAAIEPTEQASLPPGR